MASWEDNFVTNIFIIPIFNFKPFLLEEFFFNGVEESSIQQIWKIFRKTNDFLPIESQMYVSVSGDNFFEKFYIRLIGLFKNVPKQRQN